MSIPWAILTGRYGQDVRQPSHAELRQAVDELYDENIVSMSEAGYAEHPNAWLKYGTDEGPTFVIDAYRNGTVILAKYADQDDDDPLRESTLQGVPRDLLFDLWASLVSGDIEGVCNKCATCDW